MRRRRWGRCEGHRDGLFFPPFPRQRNLVSSTTPSAFPIYFYETGSVFPRLFFVFGSATHDGPVLFIIDIPFPL